MRVNAVEEALVRLDDWVNRLAARLPPPVRVRLPDGDFHWRFPQQGVEVLLVCKAVRMCSAFAGAWHLAKSGQAAEAASLLRLAADFASEIHFMAEAVVEGRSTRAQSDFQTAFFKPLARSVEEYLAEEKAHYASRRDVLNAEKRLAEKAGQDGDLLDRTTSFLSYGLNAYVHGSYDTAMELYHGGTGRFVIRGFDEGRLKEASTRFASSKATEVVQGVEMVALLFGDTDMQKEVKAFLKEADPTLRRTP
jgi:hypothetical protein